MKKKFHFGGVDKFAVVEVNLRENENGNLVFSSCGEIHGKNTAQCAGQCLDEIIKMFPRNKKLKRIYEISKRWHLNDLHAGCEHQRDFEKEPYENHKDDVCPICNYKYGTAWKYEAIPQDVIDEIKSW